MPVPLPCNDLNEGSGSFSLLEDGNGDGAGDGLFALAAALGARPSIALKSLLPFAFLFGCSSSCAPNPSAMSAAAAAVAALAFTSGFAAFCEGAGNRPKRPWELDDEALSMVGRLTCGAASFSPSSNASILICSLWSAFRFAAGLAALVLDGGGSLRPKVPDEDVAGLEESGAAMLDDEGPASFSLWSESES